jgi:hypothetical protein
LLLAEPLAPLDQELQVGLYGTEIEVLGITSWCRRLVSPGMSVPDSLAATEFLRNSLGFSQLRREARRPECQMMVDERL